MTPLYLGNWSNLRDLSSDFCMDSWNEGCVEAFEVSLGDIDILLAYYDIDGYEGDAFVLFRKNGRLYEVNASHCSCYGLENQWEPEETSVKALRHRIERGVLGHGTFSKSLLAILDELEVTP